MSGNNATFLTGAGLVGGSFTLTNASAGGGIGRWDNDGGLGSPLTGAYPAQDFLYLPIERQLLLRRSRRAPWSTAPTRRPTPSCSSRACGGTGRPPASLAALERDGDPPRRHAGGQPLSRARREPVLAGRRRARVGADRSGGALVEPHRRGLDPRAVRHGAGGLAPARPSCPPRTQSPPQPRPGASTPLDRTRSSAGVGPRTRGAAGCRARPNHGRQARSRPPHELAPEGPRAPRRPSRGRTTRCQTPVSPPHPSRGTTSARRDGGTATSATTGRSSHGRNPGKALSTTVSIGVAISEAVRDCSSTSADHPSRRSSMPSESPARGGRRDGREDGFRDPGTAREAKGPSRLGQRANLQRDLDDHAERPERADHELVEVVARHVLDGPRAAPDEAAVARDDLGLEHGVAEGAHLQPPGLEAPPARTPPIVASSGASPATPVRRPRGCARARRRASRPRRRRSSRPARMRPVVELRRPQLGVELAGFPLSS